MLRHQLPNLADRLRNLSSYVSLRFGEERAGISDQFLKTVFAQRRGRFN